MLNLGVGLTLDSQIRLPRLFRGMGTFIVEGALGL